MSRHAFNSPSYTTSRNALKCLANALLLKSSTRQILVDLGYDAKLCSRLKNDNREDEFLISRIIFLLTYDTNINIERLIDQHHLAEHININIHRHAKQYPIKGKKPKVDPMEDMALTETLKLLFNITHHCPDRADTFIPSIPHILTILCRRTLSTKMPLDPPMGSLVNSLMNFDYEKINDIPVFLFPKFDPKCNTERLIEIIDLAVRNYPEAELEKELVPSLTLMRKIYEVAPKEVKILMKERILPTDEDRKMPLGRNESLSSWLLRLSTSPLVPQLRDAISSLLFDMSEKDAASFVHNVGYGFASGFLFQHNLPIPENALEAWSTNGGSENSTESLASTRKDKAELEEAMKKMNLVNPITGQLLENEIPVQGPEMTRAEKEREAERLMVLFERYVFFSLFIFPIKHSIHFFSLLSLFISKSLSSNSNLSVVSIEETQELTWQTLFAGIRLKKNGVITTENPMRKMQQEGRFEELDDDDDEE